METVDIARPAPTFWASRRVLVTGHTGFKGAWLCLLLRHLGANVTGLALQATPGGAFDIMRPDVQDNIVDIRDRAAVANAIQRAHPDVVLHLAAQALVGEGHAHPVETFATNVLGTAHVLEALHEVAPAAVLVVTSDKVYRNTGDGTAFREDSPLGGSDPYSASKAATEHVADCWRERLRNANCRLATARAGNVIGGGDQAVGRLVADVLRAHRAGAPVLLRRPGSIRPWQYVLDVLAGYLLYIQLLMHRDAPPALNFGPDERTAVTAAELTDRLQRALGDTQGWRQGDAAYSETTELRLDASQAMRTLGWRASTSIDRAVDWIVAWHQAAWRGEDMRRVGQAQIDAWLQ